jgi:pantoate--beta-alanine ligase
MSVELLRTVAEARALSEGVRQSRRRLALVPTMGYLHEGHLSLVDRARETADWVAMSIFVNPLQFGPTEDLAAYPRDLDRDSRLAEANGADLLFTPDVAEMYPQPVLTTVSVAQVSEPLEGASRPTHFAGVATVVAKLFSIVGPCRAYFGEKDFQQLAVVRRMASDLSLPVEVVGCPTLREPDGLAMSSRNVYLAPDEREAAPVVQRALRAGAALVLSGERDPAAVRDLVAGIVEAEPLAQLDYAEVVDAATLAVPERLTGNLRLLAAVRFGRARLIDNVGVTA